MLPDRKHSREPSPEPNNLEKKRKISGPENPSPVYFRPITKSKAEDTIYDIAEALDIPIEIANIIYPYMSPLPKIQFWNDYPGRATLRSQDHEIYMLGANGPLGPLGITDEKGSYSLSRKLIGRLQSTAAELFNFSLEPSGLSWMGMRETLILTELKDGKVTTWEVAEHKAAEDYHFDHIKYQRAEIHNKLFKISPSFRHYPDYTRADHRILPMEGKSPTYLKDQEGKIVEDAEIVVAANWYVLTLTRSGDLYFNQHLYMKNVRSIATASTNHFVLILNENHAHEFHRNMRLRTYLRDRNAYNGKEIEELKSIGRNFGLRDSSRRVVGPSVYIENISGRLGLQADGRLESDDIPEELESVLADGSNYVKIVAASSYFFAALLELGDGNQQVHIWSDGDNVVVDFEMHSCFKKKKPEDGTVVRKRIVDITVSDDSRSMTSQYYGYFGADRYMPSKGHPQDAIALNFEDNSSCLLSISKDGAELSFLASFPSEHTRSIHNTADGMLVVTDSKILKMTEAGRSLNIVTDSKRRRYVSFVASADGYVIVYPNGEYDASESVQPPIDIKNTIRQGGGIAEIHHDRSGTFHAVLRNGTFVSWYSETSAVFRNTPKWDRDMSLSVRSRFLPF
jgi:hypothetical protein